MLNRKIYLFILRCLRKCLFIFRRKILSLNSRLTHYEEIVSQMINSYLHFYPNSHTCTRKNEKVDKIILEMNSYIAPIMPALPRLGREPKIVLLIPTLSDSSFFGGIATAIVFSVKLAIKMQKKLRIVQTVGGGGNANILYSWLRSIDVNFPEENLEILTLAGRGFLVYGYLDLHPEDRLIVSAWWDAFNVDRLPLKYPYIYLIQDYEPCFYPNNDNYVFAQETYKSNKYIPVFNTNLLLSFFEAKGIIGSEHNRLFFEPSIIRGNPNLTRNNFKTSRKRLFIYGRPSVARNLYSIAIMTIEKAFITEALSTTEWDLFMAGQDGIPDIELSSGGIIHNLGKLSSIEYNEFIKTVDVALSLMMAPHPSYPPLELALAGVAVVTNEYDIKKDLSIYSKNIIVAKLDTTSLVNAIVAASLMSIEDRRQNMLCSILPSTWDQALSECIPQAIQLLNEELPINY